MTGPVSQPRNPPQDFAAFAAAWRKDGITQLLGYVWAGYDSLRAENPATLIPTDEVNINLHLAIRINRKMPKKCPFDVQHMPPELSTRLAPSRPPPAPDFGFFPRTDLGVMLPLEAKVLKTDGHLSEYLKALRTRFLQCRYAPYSSQGAMIGYLLKGNPDAVFKKLRGRLRAPLETHPHFQTKSHRVSNHRRTHQRCRHCPTDFRCHHLVMTMP